MTLGITAAGVAAAAGVASLALAGSTAYMSASAAGAAKGAAGILGRGQAHIENDILRPSRNQKTSAFGTLARWTQAENNKRMLEQGGDQLAAHTTNVLRLRDQAVNGSLSEQIAAAEQVGNAAASQAFNGMFGGISDAVNATTALRRDIGRTIAYKVARSTASDANVMAGQMFSQMVGGLDGNILLDTMDYGFNQHNAESQGSPYAAAVVSIADKALQMGARIPTAPSGSGGGPTTGMNFYEGASTLSAGNQVTLDSGQAFFQPSTSVGSLSIGS